MAAGAAFDFVGGKCEFAAVAYSHVGIDGSGPSQSAKCGLPAASPHDCIEPIVPDAARCTNGGHYGFQCVCCMLFRKALDLPMKAFQKAERTLLQRLSRFIRLFPMDVVSLQLTLPSTNPLKTATACGSVVTVEF